MQFVNSEDGRRIRVIKGFRLEGKGYRSAVTPRANWEAAGYVEAAAKKLRRFTDLRGEIRRWRGTVEGAHILEVGCGDSISCLLLAQAGAGSVDGIDLYLPLEDQSEKGDQIRRLAACVLEQSGINQALEPVLAALPLRLQVMDARRMSFADGSFDLLLSRSAMEHIMPIETALEEMIRVVRPGGLIHHSVDPFYWLRGCHKRGVTDIPWAHARLSDADFHRFVSQQESPEKADKRLMRIQTLNRYSLRRWREILTRGPVDVMDYRGEPNKWSVQTLAQHRDALETMLPGLEELDLVTGRINVWLRRLG